MKHQKVEKHWGVIKKYILSEKTSKNLERNTHTFRVDKKATKAEIKIAVEKIFGVEVASVNTLIRKGKSKITRQGKGQTSDVKLAYVKLPEGVTIDTERYSS